MDSFHNPLAFETMSLSMFKVVKNDCFNLKGGVCCTGDGTHYQVSAQTGSQVPHTRPSKFI